MIDREKLENEMIALWDVIETYKEPITKYIEFQIEQARLALSIIGIDQRIADSIRGSINAMESFIPGIETMKTSALERLSDKDKNPPEESENKQ